jgi:GNAT superfamily N-acetyltransferase
MEISFSPVDWAEIQPEVSRHLATLPTAIDSYLEGHIVGARHYRALVGGQVAGFAAIHNEQLITQFALDDAFKRVVQAAYRTLRSLESVQASLVPTFSTPADLAPPPAPPGLVWRLARREYVELVRRESADFFAPIERTIEAEQLFIAYAGDQCAGFGILEPSALYPDVASIGMFTLESARRQGVGTATIGFLIGECRRRGLRPIAGCWYYNHRSRQTLERAGMFARSRLLRIEH